MPLVQAKPRPKGQAEAAEALRKGDERLQERRQLRTAHLVSNDIDAAVSIVRSALVGQASSQRNMTSVTTAGLSGAMQSLSETVFMASISQWLSWGASMAMIFGGVVPYIPQYREIKKTRNTDGFSTWVCLALLVANTLRILFWFGRPFELPLLVQSIVMSASMFLMLRLCVKTRNLSTIVPQPRHAFAENPSENPACLQMVDVAIRDLTLWDSPWRHFWAWTDFLSYVEFMATFALCSGIPLVPAA
ncbi:hypothetical protein MTO96_006936 [Rhipicephalus appendiculatus]